MRRFPELAAYVASFGSMTAAATVVIVLIVLGHDSDPDRPSGPTADAVVANQSIGPGTEITEKMLEVVAVPEEELAPGAYGDPRSVIGEVAKVPIANGEPVTADKVVPRRDWAGEGIPPGKRAFVFNVDSRTAIGSKGLIVPGDHLDVLVEHVGGAITVVEDVEVLAVASTVEQDPATAPENQSADTITILTNPEQVPLLAQAAGMDANLRLLLSERPDSR